MRDVFLPETLDELWRVWDRRPAAVPYAGGTDLLVKMRSGTVCPPSLVCLERVAALKEIADVGERLRIGAGATHTTLHRHPLVGTHAPALGRAAGSIGSVAVRNVGTIGGNAATASPSGDTLPALWALDAQVELTSGSGVRTLPIAEFVLGPGVTSLRPQELITAILVKKKPRSTHHFEKVGLRSSQACSIVNLAAVFACEDDKIVEIALAWGAVGPTVIRSAEIEQALVGRPLTVEALGEVEDLVRSTVKPIDDIRASAEYRRAVAAALLFRLTAYASSGDTSAPL